MVEKSDSSDKVFLIIKSLNNTFTKTEKILADYILENSNTVIYTSIADLSMFTKVGEATIIRFCKKLGFNGYYSLKMSLAKEITDNKNYELEKDISSNEILENDTTEDVISKIHFRVKEAINGTMSILKIDDVKKAVKSINSCNKIKVYGIGSSGTCALDAKYRFSRIGYNIDSFTDSHLMVIDASLSSSSDVVIAISYSGETKDIIDAFKLAKQNGAVTIGITHFKNSKIGKIADILLLTGSQEGPLEGGVLATKSTQMFVTEILFQEIFRINSTKLTKISEITSKAIANKIN